MRLCDSIKSALNYPTYKEPSPHELARIGSIPASFEGGFLRVWHEDPDFVPKRATPGASGLDLRAWMRLPLPHATGGLDPYTLAVSPGQSYTICTGLHVSVPIGYEVQCRPRSGLASRGLIIRNSPGTIDADYRGEIKVLIHNVGPDVINVGHGDRIAQLVLCPIVVADAFLVSSPEELGRTDRGSGGFGSTGAQ